MPFFERHRLATALTVTIAFGFTWFLALHERWFLDPTNISWMIEGDWQGHLFGWFFARNAPWAVPLAGAPDLTWPTGSSAALTDSIPILTVFGKLVSPFFGLEIQFFGLWMLLGVICMGVAGVLALRTRVQDTTMLVLVGILFVVNPVVATRYGHPPFYGLWTLTGLVGLNFWPVSSVRDVRRALAVVLVLDFFACGITAYLAVMASIVTGAALLRFVFVERLLKPLEALGWLVAGPVVSVTALYLFGFVSGALSSSPDALATEGFGEFSADPLALVNPLEWSRFIQGIAIAGRQYEGYGYLGLGVLVLLVVRLSLLVWSRPSKRDLLRLTPVLVFALVCALYSLSNKVVMHQHLIADWSNFYSKLGKLPSIFRSSGRFLWPLHIVLTYLAALTATRFKVLWQGRAVLAFAVLVQVVDFNPTKSPVHRPQSTFVPFAAPEWQLLRDYKHLVIQPVQIQWACPFNPDLVAKLSWEAYRQHLTINSGHVGRTPAGTSCTRHLQPAELDADTVYVPYFQDFLADFTSAGFVCGVLDKYVVCVSPARDTELKRALQKRSQ